MVFDHVSDIHDAIVKRSNMQSKREACEWFLYQWMFASLLHDVGYAFFDLSADTKQDRSEIDKLYSWDTMETCLAQKPQADAL